MKAKRVYAISTRADKIGCLGNNYGVVGIFSSKNKAVKALNKWREKIRSFGGILDIDEQYWFTYHYEDDGEITKGVDYTYRLYWYELNDDTLLQWAECLPKMKEE